MGGNSLCVGRGVVVVVVGGWGGVKQEKEKNSLVCSILKRGETQPQITLAGT